MTTDTNAPACRLCGGERFATIETQTYWQHATIGREPDGSWTVDEWGDTVHHSDEGGSETIAYACLDCHHEADELADLVTTRRAFVRAHPVRAFWYEKPDGSRRRVSARSAFEIVGPYPRVGTLAWPVGTPRPSSLAGSGIV